MNAPALSRNLHAARTSGHSAAADLARLAIPVLLIAAAVAATLWIDRSTGFDAAAQAPAKAPPSTGR